MADKDLILRAQGGDTVAFDEIYKSVYAPVYRFILMRLKSRDEADDVTQEVFIKFFKSIGSYESRGSMLPYLFTVARNAVIDHLRKRRPDYDDEALMRVASGDPTAEQTAILGQEVAQVMRLMSQLSEAEEAAIKLKHIDGLPTTEVAELLGKTEEAVRQLLSRGIRQLRLLLESEKH